MNRTKNLFSLVTQGIGLLLIVGLIGTSSAIAADEPSMLRVVDQDATLLDSRWSGSSVNLDSNNVSCPTSLVSYWKLNETGTPTVFKDYQDANDATCTGDSCPTPYASGKVNGAQDFDGIDDQLATGGVTNPTSGLTAMAWVNPDVLTGGDKGIFFKEGAFFLELESDTSFSPDFSVLVDGGTLVEYEPIGFPVPTGAWTHIAGTYDGTDLLVYMNGVQIPGKVTQAGTIDSSMNPYLIGHSYVGSEQRYFDGKIDEVAVFNAALTPAEIAAIYNLGISKPLCNAAPDVTNPGDQFNQENDLVSLQIVASDPDGDNLTYSVAGDGLPGGLTIDSNTGLISGTIDNTAAAGSPYAVTVIVTDDGSPSESSNVQFTWTVSPPLLQYIYLPIILK